MEPPTDNGEFKIDMLKLTDKFDKMADCEIMHDAEIIETHAILEIKNGLTYQKITINNSINTITGKAKSRKSFFSLMVMAAILKGEYENLRSYGNGKVLYFDTEQGRERTIVQDKRIQSMVGKGVRESLLHTFDLRNYTPRERMEFIQHKIKTTEFLKAVFVDGLKDLGVDINSLEESTEIVSVFLKLTQEYGFSLFTVLHENPGNEKVRGHLGTEMINKSEVVFEVNKYEQDNSLSLVRAKYIRERDFEPFLIGINEGHKDADSIPYLSNDEPTVIDEKSNARKPEFWNISDDVHKNILVRVFDENTQIYHALLLQMLHQKYKETHGLGITKVKAFIPMMKLKGWIYQTKKLGPYEIKI